MAEAARYGGMSTKQLAAPVDQRELIDAQAELVEILKGKFDAIERRLAEIEAKAMRYQGSYQRAIAYKRGSACTHNGALFVAVRDAAEDEQPGKSSAWQLTSKTGDRR